MKSQSKFAAISLGLGLIASVASATDSYHGYYRFLGDSPAAAEPAWSNDAQGLAHDDNNWFMTNNAGQIWKVPLSHDLCCTEAGDDGVLVQLISSLPQLAGYTEYKDPVARPYNGVWYLFVPLAGENQRTAVAVFRADTLAYLDHHVFQIEPGQPVGGDILPSWCALSAANKLFLPDRFPGFTDGVIEYSIDWNALAGPGHQFIPTYERVIPLLNENGAPLYFEFPQGGEFSLDGELLYTVTGYLDDSEAELVSEGIHAFDTTTWRRVGHSTNGSGLFNYAWEPGFKTAEEPQGLTMWDLDGRNAPGRDGQMRVIMLDNDLGPDDIYLKRYTNRIWVNASSSIPIGIYRYPFSTVTQAASLAWDRCEIHIQAGIYDEAVTIVRRAKLFAEGGSVRIGG